VHHQVQPVLSTGAPAAPRERLAIGALLAGFAVVLLFRLGAADLQSHAEQRVWDVMRGMDATGDWLVPRQGGAVRLNKPPLYYWCATACAAALGGGSLVALRLPAALAALALVWVTWRWGRSLGGPRLGLLAAAALACMELFGTQGRTGVAEMFLALFCTLGLATFDRMALPPEPGDAGARRHRRLLPLFALWTALAILSKATVALMILGVPAALLLVLERRARRAFTARVAGWVALAVVLGFAWYLIVTVAVPGAFRTLQATLMLPLGVRLPGAETSAGHMRAPTFFLASLALSAFPVTVLLPSLVARGWRSRLWSGQRVRFVALAFVSLFLCFSAIPQKQKHYMLPLLPLLALLCAESLVALETHAPAALRRLLVVLGVLACALAVPVLGLLHVVYVQAMHLPPAAWAGVAVLTVALLAWLMRSALRGDLPAFTGAALTGGLLALLCYHGSLEPWQRQFESGDVARRPDYDPARWRAVFAEWPALEGAFRAGATAASDPVTADPVATDPVTTDPAAAHPFATEPFANDPADG